MAAKKMGLKININETKYMQMGSKSPKKGNLKFGDSDFEAVDRFIYLGS
jgi:hypothetical protein